MGQRWLEIAPSVVTTSVTDVQNRLEGIMDFRQEGIILKDVESKYFFNARNRGWYKVKPEYEDGLAETLDLIVVGAFFGDSARRRGLLGQSADLADNISQFLLAARKGSGAEGENVVTVCKVGTGYSMEQLREIRDRIRPHLRRYDPHRAPAWLGGWRGTARSKPDAIIDSPGHSFVMEVRAAEFIPSDDYELGHTLRFPRSVVPIRADKDWSDATTEEDLREFIRGGRNQLTLRRTRPKVEVRSDGEDTDEGAQQQNKRRRKGKGKGRGAFGSPGGPSRMPLRRGDSFGVLDGFREADTTHVPVASQLLKGAEVFVVNGDKEYSKADLESYVVRHGGRNVQNFIRGRTSLVVAASMSDLRARNLAKTAQVDIVVYRYLFQCESAGRMLPQKPRDLLSWSPESRERFAAAYDKWGDAYYVAADREELRETLSRIPEHDLEAVPEDIVNTLSQHPRLRQPGRADGEVLSWATAESEAAAVEGTHLRVAA